MSLASMWSGNVHQLRNSLGSNLTAKLLRVATRFVPAKSSDTRRCKNPQQLAPVVEEQTQEAQNFFTPRSCLKLTLHHGMGKSSTNKNTNQPELHELKAVQCYNIQGSTSVEKAIDWPATIFVFDIETTGFSYKNEKIIELAVRDLIGGKNSAFQTLINPEKKVLNAGIHGIHTSMVNRPDIPTFRELIPILLQYVQSRQMAGRPVLWVAHNGRRFDVPFIIKEFERCYMEVPADWVFIDTLLLANKLVKQDGSKLSSLSLKALREHYEIPLFGPAHRAMQDVMTLCHVFQRITFDLKLTVPELMDRAFRASDIVKVPL